MKITIIIIIEIIKKNHTLTKFAICIVLIWYDYVGVDFFEIKKVKYS